MKVRRPGDAVKLAGTCLPPLILAGVMSAAVLRFPFDSPLSVLSMGMVVLLTALFSAGLFGIVLAKSFRARIAGTHAMAVAAALLLVFLSGDGLAWILAAGGWAVVAAVGLWGRFLFRQSAPGGWEGGK